MFNRNVKTGEVTKVINQADEFLGSITDKIIGNNYICTGLPEDMLEEATGSTNRLINIPNDMKIRLLEALVRMEEIVG
jgi:phospholipase/lecithinase/hemolysin